MDAPDPLGPGGKTDTLASTCLNEDGLFEELGLEDGTDLGFYYVWPEEPGERGRCVDDDGNEGLNPACLGVCGDLSGRSLEGWDIQWWWMNGIDFSNANLSGTKFRNAQMAGAVFRGADLTGVDFTTSSVEYADFRNALLANVYLGFAYLSHADFRGAKFPGAWWSNTKAFGADFRGAKMGSPLGFQYMHACGLAESASCIQGARYSDTTTLPFHPDKVGYYGLVKAEDDPIPDGDVYALILPDGGQCLDLVDKSTDEGAPAAIGACDQGDSQLWKFAPSEGGAFRVVNIASNLCLEVEDGSSTDGAAIVQAACTGGDRQRWIVTLRDDDVSLVNKRSTKCLDVSESGAIEQSTCDLEAGQVWERQLRL